MADGFSAGWLGKMGAWGVCVLLAVAVVCALGADEENRPARDEPEKEIPAWQVAPDGVLYADRNSYEVMQMKPLGPNLLTNGSFEVGRYWPLGWDPMDRLGTFWVQGGSHGKRCIRLYTDLVDDQWVEWNETVLAAVDEATTLTKGKPQSLKKDPVPAPPPRKPTSPPYYDTVAGLHGIHYRSPMIKITLGAIYRVSVDASADVEAAPKVFTKGFFRHRGLLRNAGRAPMALRGCGEKWKRYARTFGPSDWKSTLDDKPISAELLQVQLYAYWPVGNYYYDNVRLEIVGMKEPEPEEEKGETGGAASGKDREEEKPPELGEDEFPVFDP